MIAALIPSAARLMLAVLERTVTDFGGYYAFCDTDSMAVIATAEYGGMIECPGRGALGAEQWQIRHSCAAVGGRRRYCRSDSARCRRTIPPW